MVTILLYVALIAALLICVMSNYFAKHRVEWPIFPYWFITPFSKLTPLLIHRISWIISLISMGVAVILRAIEQGHNPAVAIFCSICMLFTWWLAIILFCWVVYCLRFFIKNLKHCLKPIAKWFQVAKDK